MYKSLTKCIIFVDATMKPYKKHRKAVATDAELSPEAMLGGIHQTLTMVYKKSLTVEEAIEMIRKIIAKEPSTAR